MSVNEYPYETNVLTGINTTGRLIQRPLHKWGGRSWKVTTGPLVEPVTVDDVKLFGHIDGTTEHVLLEAYITSVRDTIEGLLGKALIEQTITLLMDWWPGTKVELPRPPLIAVTSIHTLDEDDTATLYSSDNYYYVTNKEPGIIVIKNGASPPSNTDRYHGGYRVIFTAGYSTDPADVPSAIKNMIIAWVASIYESRIFDPKNPPPVVKAMLSGSNYEIPKI